jgi:tetratricopeptide (TPR) repeat protein
MIQSIKLYFNVYCFVVIWLFTMAVIKPLLAEVTSSREDSFDRLSFNSQGRVEYSTQRFDLELLMQFSSPISGKLKAKASQLGKFVKAARFQNFGREAVITLTSKHKFRVYRKGDSIILDVGDIEKADFNSTKPSSKINKPKKVVEELEIRVGKHLKYERIVFEWSSPPKYEVVYKTKSVDIVFEKFAQIDVESLRKKVSANLATINIKGSKQVGLTVSIAQVNRASLRHFLSGNKVVIDLLKEKKVGYKQPDLKNGSSRKSKLINSSVPKSENSLTTKLGLNILNGSKSRDLTFKSTIPIEDKAVKSQPGKVLKQEKLSRLMEKKENEKPLTQVIGKIKIKDKSIVPLGEIFKVEKLEQSNQQGSQFLRDPKWLVKKSGDEKKYTINGPRIVVKLLKKNNIDSLYFNWNKPVPAAVFTRAGYLWVVFDEKAKLDLSEIQNSNLQIIRNLMQLPAKMGAVFRAKIAPGISPSVWRDGEAWVVDLSPQLSRPDVALKFVTQQTSPQGPRVFVLADRIGDFIEIRDPEVGDNLFIVPIESLSRGIETPRQFAQFEILKSIQGLVINPLIDELEVRVMPDGIAITASEFRGLEVSKRSEKANQSRRVGRKIDGLPTGLEPGRIFNLETWRQGARQQDFLEIKQTIQQQISQATSIARGGPRLRLGQFYFAKGLAAETMGLLRTISDSDEKMSRRPDVIALRGASQFMLGRFSESEKELDNSVLNGFSEVELWRGASNAAQGKWAAAIEHFARAGEIPGDYPRNFSIQLALLAAEAAIRAEDYRGAGVFLDAIAQGRPTIGEQARLNYLRGRVLYASSDITTALNFWRRLTNSSDRWARVRAKRALIEHELREKTITRTQAIESLEQLRFAWRGDQLEFDLLRRLGELYIEEKDFVSGLKALRQAVTFFPNNIFARSVSKKMTKSFSSIYTDGTSDAMTPLTALSLYDQFRELTPVGKRGDKIIQRLADRLVEVDLLDRASILLDRQVRFRLRGAQKAKVGSRLALIRLLDRQPGTALDALDESVAPGLGADLSLQRKRLRARSVFALGDSEAALKLIKGDNKREADLLRADIFWRTRNWADAGQVFERLIGNAGRDGRRINDLSASLIINWVVALSMSDQKDSLNRARQVYAAQMDMTEYREAFRLITNKTEGSAEDFRTLTERFKEIGRFQAFLTSYREKLKVNLLSQLN